MNPIFYDTETVGFQGMAVLIQYAEGDSAVTLHEVWRTPIYETISLIERMMTHDGGVIGFNLAFDHFHLCKLYTTFNLHNNHNDYPEDIVEELARLEAVARDGYCLKPKHVFDVMLHARKGPYQSTMDRENIRIKKVPAVLAYPLAIELERRIKIKDIYFAKKKNKYEQKWKIYDIEDQPDFKDIVLSFQPSNALKALAVDALNISLDSLLLFGDIEIEKEYVPSAKKEEELGYAPFALAVKTLKKARSGWGGAWPDKIERHISFWANNELARKYATDDVIYTRDLYKHFGSPPLDDDDSILSCLTAAARWKGYAVDIANIKKLRAEATIRAANVPTAPAAVRKYIYFDLSETERTVLQSGSKLDESTAKLVLEELAKQTEVCSCSNDPHCTICEGIGTYPNKVALKAREVIEARMANYEVDFYDKLILAGRLHASYNIIGTLSSRMSGSDSLNVQGIKKAKAVRACFPLAFNDFILCGGDFESFEVTLADAQFNDPDLRKELLKVIDCPFCQGVGCKECDNTGKHKQTIHGMFGTFVYPGMSYIDVLKTKGSKDDKYAKSKSAVFTMLYGGEAYTLKERLGVPLETAERAYDMFTNKFRRVGEERRKIGQAFCSMSQPNGIGGKVEWSEPADKIESMFGFPRYFTLENQICKALFQLAEKPPKQWLEFKMKVVRRDREQTASGALRSALYAAAFNIQGQNTRAAINHVIQSAGAQTTKALQCRIWELQPYGFHPWITQPMNVHDEILTPTHPDFISKQEAIVNNFIEAMKPKVPLIAIGWKNHMKSWAEK